MTRENLRNAASTLAHHWEHGEGKGHIGVERLLLAYPTAHQSLLSALILGYLFTRNRAAAETFEDFLYDLAVCP